MMEYKYYETWMFQNGITEISKDSLKARKIFFRFYFERSLNCQIGQRCLRGKYSDIYYVGKEFDDIWSYHQKNFAEFDYFNVIRNVSDYSIICQKFKKDIFIGFLVCTCDQNYNPKGISTFNENSELLEYREATYTPDNDLLKDKIFIPSLWETFEQDY